MSCPNCSNTTPEGTYLCVECMKDGMVLRHDYKPNTWKGMGARPRLGVELEISTPSPEARRRIVKTLYAKMPNDLFYLKHDGSIPPRGGGFEIVSNPLGMELHERWWGALLDGLREASINYLTGLHVHMERLPPLSQGKLVELVNSKQFYPLLWYIGGRTPPDSHSALLDRDIFMGRSRGERLSWLSKQPKKVIEAKHHALSLHLQENRYEAVNISGPTLELRFFASTLNPEVLMTRLEVAMWLRKYIMCTGVGTTSQVPNFIKASLECGFKRVRKLMREGGF